MGLALCRLVTSQMMSKKIKFSDPLNSLYRVSYSSRPRYHSNVGCHLWTTLSSNTWKFRGLKLFSWKIVFNPNLFKPRTPFSISIPKLINIVQISTNLIQSTSHHLHITSKCVPVITIYTHNPIPTCDSF